MPARLQVPWKPRAVSQAGASCVRSGRLYRKARARAARAAGVAWRAGSPVVWHPRALNSAADALCTWALLRRCGLQWHSTEVTPETFRRDRWAFRLFSDGGRREVAGEMRVAWAALLLGASSQASCWRLLAAEAGHLDAERCGVAEAEARALRGGFALWARTRGVAFEISPSGGAWP